VDQHGLLLDLAKIPAESEPAEAPRGDQPEGSEPPRKSRTPAEILAQIPCFRGLHKVQIRKVLKLCTVVSFKAGEEVCRIDTPSDEMFILISGELAVSRQGGSQLVTITPVTMVGVLGFMANFPRTVALEATAASKVLCLSRSRFDRLFENDHDIKATVYLNIIGFLADALIRLRGLVDEAVSSRT